MLKIINNLKPFFEDCYRRINVREYAKISKVSPPTASKTLTSYYDEIILKKEEYKNHIFFYANKENKIFIELSRIYWTYKMKDLVDFLNKNLISPKIILFGSLAKGEATKNSDVDLAIFSKKEEIDIRKFEKKLGRKVQLFWFDSFENIKDYGLKNNILNGYVLEGKIRI